MLFFNFMDDLWHTGFGNCRVVLLNREFQCESKIEDSWNVPFELVSSIFLYSVENSVSFARSIVAFFLLSMRTGIREVINRHDYLTTSEKGVVYW